MCISAADLSVVLAVDSLVDLVLHTHMPFVLKEMKMILNGEACALCRVVSLGSLLPIIGGRSNEIVAIASDDRLRVPMRWHPLRPRRGSITLILWSKIV